MTKNGPLALAFNALVIAFMLAPLVVVCVVAFTPENTLTLPTTEFSLRWFRAVFEHSDFMQSFWNSLWLALASATIATLLAVPAGLAITRYNFRGRDFLNALFLSPLIIPHLVLGVALLRMFALVGGTGSFGFLIFAHALIVTPCNIIGSVMRVKTVACVAPSDSAACSVLQSKPTSAATTRRSVYGVTMSACAMIRKPKLPVPPISANRRSKATPSTRCGMISGDRNKPLRKLRPGNS